MTTSAMTAVAAIANPLADTDPDGAETFLFYMTNNNNFAIQRRKSGSQDPNSTITIPPGLLANPSSLCALRYKNAIECYGMLAGVDSTNVAIYELFAVSPFYRFLGFSTYIPVNAACGDGKQLGWLYFLNYDKLKKTTLCEQMLAGGPTPQMMSEPSPLITSYLAACYEPIHQTRYIFYQGMTDDDSSQAIHCFQVDNHSQDLVVDGTDDVKTDNSPLACCVIPHPSGTGNLVVLYFTQNGGSLRRKTYDPATSKWKGSDSAIAQAPLVDQASQLTVMPDFTMKKIRVYCVEKNNPTGGFVLWEDDFAPTD